MFFNFLDDVYCKANYCDNLRIKVLKQVLKYIANTFLGGYVLCVKKEMENQASKNRKHAITNASTGRTHPMVNMKTNKC